MYVATSSLTLVQYCEGWRTLRFKCLTTQVCICLCYTLANKPALSLNYVQASTCRLHMWQSTSRHQQTHTHYSCYTYVTVIRAIFSWISTSYINIGIKQHDTSAWVEEDVEALRLAADQDRRRLTRAKNHLTSPYTISLYVRRTDTLTKLGITLCIVHWKPFLTYWGISRTQQQWSNTIELSSTSSSRLMCSPVTSACIGSTEHTLPPATQWTLGQGCHHDTF